MTTIGVLLIDALGKLGREFDKNELAYLAITSKIESVVRDRLAFYLHRKLEAEGIRVAREWKRVDLAILDKRERPIALIETKAMYTFDPIRKRTYYTDYTRNDEEKAARKAPPATQVFSLLLSAHLHSPIPQDLMATTKYSTTLNKYLKKNSEITLRNKAKELVQAELKNRSLLTHHFFRAGEAFGIPVSVDYWLVKRKNGGAKVQ